MTHPVLPAKIQELLAQLPAQGQLDFFRLLEVIDTIRFTGPVTFDFLNGKPKQINLGQPIRLSIVDGGTDRV